MAVELQHLKKMAHDMRSPLQVLINFFTYFEKMDVPEALKGQGDLANLAIERLKGIADRLDELAGS